VRISSVEIKSYTRRLKVPLITSHGSISERLGWIIRVELKNGFAGYGEAGKSLIHDDPGGNEILNEAVAGIKDRELPNSPAEVENLVNAVCPQESAAIRFGFETALSDLTARIANMPLCQWLGGKVREEIPVNYLLLGPVNDWNVLKTIISEKGYCAVKIKVGSANIEDDVETVRMTRDTLGPNVAIRLDANRGWTFDQAREALKGMHDYDIEYIEEPMEKYDPERLIELKNQTGVKIALDESLTEIEDMKAVLKAGVCEVLILKPAVIGGFLKTLRLYKMAKRYRCRAVMTSTLETEIGIAAHLHMAAMLKGEILPFGLDTLRLYGNADQSLSLVKNGSINLPAGNGISIGDSIWDNL
jgi:o-succinylbenzoate synthase